MKGLIIILGLAMFLTWVSSEMEKSRQHEIDVLKAMNPPLPPMTPSTRVYYDTVHNKMYDDHWKDISSDWGLPNKKTTDWIKPAGKDYNISKNKNDLLLWEKQKKNSSLKQNDKQLEEFEFEEIEEYYEHNRD